MKFSEFNIMAWNVRGAAGKLAWCQIKSLVSHFKPSLLIIMETHVVFNKLRLFWKMLGFDPMGVTEARGHRGGIWVLSSDPMVRCTLVDLHYQMVTINLQCGSCS